LIKKNQLVEIEDIIRKGVHRRRQPVNLLGRFLKYNHHLRKDFYMNVMFPVPHRFIESEMFRGYKTNIKLVYFWLLKLSDQMSGRTGWFYMPNKIMSKESGISVDVIRSAKKDGLIEVVDDDCLHVDDVGRTSYVRIKDWRKLLKESRELEK